MNDAHFTEKDREMLVTLSVQMGRALDDIKDLKDNYSGRINLLEINKANKVEADKCHFDFEKRIRRLETLGFMLVGALIIAEAYFKFFDK